MDRIESSLPGVIWEKDRKKWRVSIKRDGKKIYLGRRETLEEATKLRRDAEGGIFPTDEEKLVRLFDKMARVRMRAVWREATKGGHDWKSFDDFMVSVGDRPKAERKLVAKDESRPIGPDNFQWVKPKYDYQTKEGRSEYQKAHRAENPLMYKGKHFQKKFGITIAQYQAMLEEQKSVCAICGKPERGTRNGITRWLNVDHNHDTNAVRGLLCTNCNVAVGMMFENRDILRAAISYLDKWDA
jgi:hypothetical protein